jgi:hypothetical protein
MAALFQRVTDEHRGHREQSEQAQGIHLVLDPKYVARSARWKLSQISTRATATP